MLEEGNTLHVCHRPQVRQFRTLRVCSEHTNRRQSGAKYIGQGAVTGQCSSRTPSLHTSRAGQGTVRHRAGVCAYTCVYLRVCVRARARFFCVVCVYVCVRACVCARVWNSGSHAHGSSLCADAILSWLSLSSRAGHSTNVRCSHVKWSMQAIAEVCVIPLSSHVRPCCHISANTQAIAEMCGTPLDSRV